MPALSYSKQLDSACGNANWRLREDEILKALGIESEENVEEMQKPWRAHKSCGVEAIQRVLGIFSVAAVPRSAKEIHVLQKYSWDCGIAAVEMALRWATQSDGAPAAWEEIFDQIGSKRIWSIQLVQSLLHLNDRMHVAFATTSFGVDPGLGDLSFYRDAIVKDGDKISRLFAELHAVAESSKRLALLQGSLTKESMASLLERENILIIALVDARYLQCERCSWKDCRCQRSFIGHYIVLCSFFRETERVCYFDPACGSAGRPCIMSMDALQACRQSFGTDEDTIIIRRCCSGR